MSRFEQIGGGHHVGEDGNKTKIGDVVSSDRNLDTAFPDKFVRLAEDRIAQPAIAAEAPAPAVVEEDAGVDEAEDSGDERGEDITRKFPLAAGLEVEVFKTDEGTYNVYEIADPEDPLNEDALASLKKVKTFLKAYGE